MHFLQYELPKTRHDLDSFTLDVPFATEAMFTFTVTGVFVDRTTAKANYEAVRHFSRSFNLIPVAGGGVLIANETLFVTVATKMQTKERPVFFPAAWK